MKSPRGNLIIRYLLAVSLAATLTMPTLAEVQLPDSPHGRGAQLFIDALTERPAGGYDTEDVEEAFAPGIIERNGTQRLVQILEMLHEDLFDGSDPQLLELTREGDHLTLVIEGAHMAARMDLDLSPEHGFRVDGIAVRPSGSGPAIPEVAESEIPAAIADFIDELAAEDQFSGAVLVAKDGEPVFAQAYGYADREMQRPNTLDTPINLGSINKMFTAIAIGQLAEAGLIDFDATVGDYLPDFPLVEARAATLDQVLTHTAGLGDYIGQDTFFDGPKDEVDSLSDLIPWVVEGGMVGAPGAQNRYSNSGPVVMGLILEAVTGQDYYEYMREHVYGPAGMVNSDSYAYGEQPAAGVAIGYHRERPDQPRESDRGWHPRMGSAAGGGYASANDMLRLSQALMDDTLLSREMRETLWTPRTELGSDFSYGYYTGIHLFGDGNIRGVGHNGGAPGVNAEFLIFPELGYTVIVLSNYSRAATPLAEWMFGMVAANAGHD